MLVLDPGQDLLRLSAHEYLDGELAAGAVEKLVLANVDKGRPCRRVSAELEEVPKQPHRPAESFCCAQ